LVADLAVRAEQDEVAGGPRARRSCSVEEDRDAERDSGGIAVSHAVAERPATGGAAASERVGAAILEDEGEAVGALAESVVIGELEAERRLEAVRDELLVAMPGGARLVVDRRGEPQDRLHE
jgi:hypothetical protein